MIKLDLNIQAVPHQSVRVTKRGFTYQPKKIKDYKQTIQTMVREQLSDHFCIIPAGTPIAITKLHYVFEYPKSMSKVKRLHTKYKTTKPDLHDNLNKALFDALEGVVWEQDQNICKMDNVEKIYGEKSRIIMNIEPIYENS